VLKSMKYVLKSAKYVKSTRGTNWGRMITRCVDGESEECTRSGRRIGGVGGCD
jgi:hypothetical protein